MMVLIYKGYNQVLTFTQFINLFEDKLSDIKRMHVKSGNSPDVVDDVITRAQTANKQGAKINIGMPFPHVKNAVEQHEQKQASKSDIQTIHHNPKTGVTIKQVNTKDACIKGYGGGKTNWCVAATGEGNLYKKYGEGGKRFFTIHHKNKVYGAHEHEDGTIRDKTNKSVKPPDDVYKAMAKTPELSKINIMSQNPHFTVTEDHITNALKDHTNSRVAEAALKEHPNKIKSHHIDLALQNPSDRVALRALYDHKDKIQPHHIDMALQHSNGEVSYAALYDHKDKIQPHHIDMALQHPDASVAEAAVEFHKDKIQPHHIDIVKKRGII